MKEDISCWVFVWRQMNMDMLKFPYAQKTLLPQGKNFEKVSIMVWKLRAFMSHMQNLIFQILLFSLYPRQNPGKNVSEWSK